jgi:hypothetical protein
MTGPQHKVRGAKAKAGQAPLYGHALKERGNGDLLRK